MMDIFCTHCQHCNWSPEDGFAISLSLWLWGPRHGQLDFIYFLYMSVDIATVRVLFMQPFLKGLFHRLHAILDLAVLLPLF